MRRSSCFAGAIAIVLVFFANTAPAQEKHRDAAVLREIFDVQLLPDDVLMRPPSANAPLDSEEKGVADINRRWSRIHELLVDNQPGGLVGVAFEMMQAHRKTLYPLSDGRHVPAWLLISRYLDSTIAESEAKARKELLPPIQSFSDIQLNMRTLNEYVQQNIYRDDIIPAAAELVEVCAASGNYSLAIQTWINILQVKRDIKLKSPQVLLTLAKCWDCIGEKGKSKALLEGAKKLYPGAEVKFAGETMPLEKAIERLEKDMEASPKPALRSDWPMYWGSPSRASIAAGELSRGVAWRMLTPAVRDMMETEIQIPVESRHALPAAVPLTYKGIVYTRSAGSVVAREAATGKILWSYRTPDSYSGNSGETHYLWGPNAEELWQMAIGEGWLIIAPTNNYTKAPGENQAFYKPFLLGFNLTYPTPAGTPIWKRGGRQEEDQTLASASCVSSIVPAGQNAYAIIMDNDTATYYLICIEGSTGKIAWKQAIEQAEPAPQAATKYNLDGAGPVVDGPFVYVTTADGTVRAHDTITGETRWVYRFGPEPPKQKQAPKEEAFKRRTLDEEAAEQAEHYEDMPDRSSRGRQRREAAKVEMQGTHFPRPRPSIALANGGIVSIYQRNNKWYLLSTDRFRASAKWTLEVQAGSIITAVGDNAAFVFNKIEKKIYAYNLETGKQEWTATLEEALNRPMLFGNKLLCPTPEALVTIDSTNGKTVSTTPWNDLSIHVPFVHEAISIVPSEGRIIISSGYEMVAIFSKDYEDTAAARLKANPSDANSLYEVAITARARKEYDSAIANFTKILELATLPKQFVSQDLLNKSAEQLAAIYNEQNAYDKALAVYQPDYIAKSYEYVNALIKSGKETEGAAEILKILNDGKEQIAEPESGVKVATLPLVLRTMMNLAGKETVLNSLPAEERKTIEKLIKAHAANEQVLPQGIAWEMQQSPQAPSFTTGGFCMLSGNRLAMVRNGRVEVREAATGTLAWQATMTMLPARFRHNGGPALAEGDLFGSAKGQLGMGDTITKVNGKPVASVKELAALVADVQPNTKLKLELYNKKNIEALAINSDEHALPWMHPDLLRPFDNGNMLLVLWPGGLCRVYSAADGAVKATYSVGGLDGNVIDMIIVGNKLFATWFEVPERETNGVGAYDLTTGREIWRTKYIAQRSVEPMRQIGNTLMIRGGKSITLINTDAPDGATAVKRFDVAQGPTNIPNADYRITAWGSGKFIISLMQVVNGSTFAYNIETQAQAWTSTGYTALRSDSSEIKDDTPIVVIDHTKIKAVKAGDGSVIWQRDTGPIHRGIVTTSADTIFRTDLGPPRYVPRGGMVVFQQPVYRPADIEAIDLPTGRTRWNINVNNPVSVKYINGNLIVVTQEDPYLMPPMYEGNKVVRPETFVPAKVSVHIINPVNGQILQTMVLESTQPPEVYPAGCGYLVVSPTAIRGFFPKFK